MKLLSCVCSRFSCDYVYFLNEFIGRHFTGKSQNSLEELVDNCSVGEYLKESKPEDEELWEECENQEFSEELMENVCNLIILLI